MSFFSKIRRAPLEHQLSLLLLVVVAPLVFVLGSFGIVRQTLVLRGNFIQKNLELSDLIGYNMAPGIEFNDRKALHEVLNSLTRTGEIAYALVRNRGGEVLCSFQPERFNPNQWSKRGSLETEFQAEMDLLHVRHPIVFLERNPGMLLIGFSLQRPNREAWINLALFLGVLVVTLLAILSVARRFGALITNPISQLKMMAERISRKEYSVPPLNLEGTQEIEFLGKTFVDMLRAIRYHQEDLRLLNQTLEQKVIDRTRELEVQTLRAQESERRKGEFLTNMSHELRTPLTSILAWPDIIIQFYERREEVLLGARQIKKTAGHLLQLINDLIDMESLDTGHLRITLSPMDVTGPVHEAIQHLSGFALSRHQNVVIELPPALPPVLVDATRFKQIIINLLSNAIKFSGEGGMIRIRGSLSSDGVCVAVEDQGPGLAPGDMSIIFKRFQQVDGSLRRKFGGSGIGLYLAKSLTELMGGNLSVSGGENGSVFSVCFPLAPGLG